MVPLVKRPYGQDVTLVRPRDLRHAGEAKTAALPCQNLPNISE